MGVEREKRYVAYPSLAPKDGRGLLLTQGYLASSDGNTVRVRVVSSTLKDTGYLTVKGSGTEVRAEFEYEVSAEDAASMLLMCRTRVSKVRRRVACGGFVWTVDWFSGEHDGLVLAEIEYGTDENPGLPSVLPAWVGPEVTEDPQYTSGALASAGRVPASWSVLSVP